jgi:CBS domain-containing protein
MTQRGLEMVRISPLEAADDGFSTARTVADVMRRDVSAVSPGMPIERAGRVLLDRKTPALPVVATGTAS